MPEIIDILTPQEPDCPGFVVNTAAPTGAVPIIQPIPGASVVYYAGAGASRFARGDNFTLLSAGYFIPERFVLHNYDTAGTSSDSTPIWQLQGLPLGAGVPISLFNVGVNGAIRVPMPNYEFSFGVFVDVEANNFVQPTFQLVAVFPLVSGLDNPQISMVDVPAALNGVIFRIIPFLKVLHNTTLTV